MVRVNACGSLKSKTITFEIESNEGYRFYVRQQPNSSYYVWLVKVRKEQPTGEIKRHKSNAFIQTFGGRIVDGTHALGITSEFRRWQHNEPRRFGGLFTRDMGTSLYLAVVFGYCKNE